jgi:hypothetical protein
MRGANGQCRYSLSCRAASRQLAAIIFMAGVPHVLSDEPEAIVIRAIERFRQDARTELLSRTAPARLADDGWLTLSPALGSAHGNTPWEIESDQPVFFCAGLTLEDPPGSQPSQASADIQPTPDSAASDHEALAKKLSNPVADLISVPFQSNFNFGGGVDSPPKRVPLPLLRLLPTPVERVAARLLTSRLREQDREYAFKYLLNFQPVIPITLNDDWNVISRTILPIVAQDDVLGASSQGGLGDTVQSFFFSPKKSEPFIWGVGPVFLLPTATDHNLLGSYRWGAGPTGVILKQSGPWTYGVLANHIWSFARDDGRKEVNATFLQPFLSYTFKTATTLLFNTESTYDWIDEQWNVPLFAGVGQVVKIGGLPVQLQLGGQYWVEGPDSAPDWSLRFNVTFLFPK